MGFLETALAHILVHLKFEPFLTLAEKLVAVKYSPESWNNCDNCFVVVSELILLFIILIFVQVSQEPREKFLNAGKILYY